MPFGSPYQAQNPYGQFPQYGAIGGSGGMAQTGFGHPQQNTAAAINPSVMQQLFQQAQAAQSGYTAGEATQIQSLQNQGVLNQALTGSQIGYQGAEGGLQLGQLGISGEQIGLQQQGVGAQQKLLGGQEQLASQQYAQQLLQMQQQQQRQERGLMGSAATGGGITAGTRYGQQNISQDYANSLKNAQLARTGQLQQFGFQSGQLGRESQSLSLAAKANGISEQEVRTRMDYAISQLGLQGKITSEQLLAQIAGAKMSGDQSILQMLGPLYLASGLSMASLVGG